MRIALLLGLVALCGCGSPCIDCCPPGDPGTTPATVGCRLVRADGGPLAGAAARCSRSDAGAVTDSSGSFSLTVQRATCGLASGNVDCSDLRLFEDGGVVTFADPSSGARTTEINAGRLTGGSCLLVAQ